MKWRTLEAWLCTIICYASVGKLNEGTSSTQLQAFMIQWMIPIRANWFVSLLTADSILIMKQRQKVLHIRLCTLYLTLSRADDKSLFSYSRSSLKRQGFRKVINTLGTFRNPICATPWIPITYRGENLLVTKKLKTNRLLQSSWWTKSILEVINLVVSLISQTTDIVHLNDLSRRI